jgi:hypothetical protein
LDNRSNQNHLRKALDDQGITLHNIRTERGQDPFNIRQSESSEQNRQGSDRDGDDRGGGGKRGGQQQDRNDQRQE